MIKDLTHIIKDIKMTMFMKKTGTIIAIFIILGIVANAENSDRQHRSR